MKVQLTWIFCIPFLGCAQPRDIAIPEASIQESSNAEGDQETAAPPEGTPAVPDPATEPAGSLPPPVETPPLTEPAPVPNPNPGPVVKAPVEVPELVTAEFPGAHAAAATLRSYYTQSTGLWPDGWWSSANSLTALIDYMQLSGSHDYVALVDNTFEKNKANGFINEYYDDTAWWGIAWVKAYDLTKNTKYLDAAKNIADYMMSKGWDQTCGGGFYFKTDHLTKDAGQNELYIKLAAALHNRIPGDTVYLAHAQKAWKWFLGSGLINSENLINETLDLNCKNPGDETWSYTQGIILGALTELYLATGDKTLLEKARTLALASTASLAPAGKIIRERHDTACGTCNGNIRIFKGNFVRGLGELNRVLKDPVLDEYLKVSAAAAWSNARGTHDRIGFRWQGPYDSADSARQTSAVDLFNSRIPMKKRTNFALNRPVTARASCSAMEGPSALVDGSAATKICSTNQGSSSITIDLGEEKMLNSIRILHAGAGGETVAWNTSDFEISLSLSPTDGWASAAKIVGNKSNATVHAVSQKARYIRLHVTQAGSDNIVRIYELVAE